MWERRTSRPATVRLRPMADEPVGPVRPPDTLDWALSQLESAYVRDVCDLETFEEAVTAYLANHTLPWWALPGLPPAKIDWDQPLARPRKPR